MKDAIKKASELITKKIFLLVSGSIGLTGGLIIALLLLLIIVIVGAIAGSSNDDTEISHGNIDANDNLSPHVLKYEPLVRKYAEKEGIGEFVPVILAIIQQESGGSPSATDPMQSSESLCGYIGCITDPDHSIAQGVKHFKSVLTQAGGDLLLAVHSYNFGSGFIDYVKNKNGKYTFNKTVGDKKAYDLAIKFSQEQYQKQVEMGNGGSFSCLRKEAKPFNACYGDILYTWSVMQYVSFDSSGSSNESVPIPSSGSFMKPTNGPITSYFGPRWGRNHNGIDYGIARGTAIVSSADGVVSKIHMGCSEGNFQCGSGWGNHVFVEHNVKGKRYTTVYAHLSKSVNISVGRNVKKGQQIAQSGNTGHSTGPHLHFELHDGGYRNPVDPIPYLK